MLIGWYKVRPPEGRIELLTRHYTMAYIENHQTHRKDLLFKKSWKIEISVDFSCHHRWVTCASTRMRQRGWRICVRVCRGGIGHPDSQFTPSLAIYEEWLVPFSVPVLGLRVALISFFSFRMISRTQLSLLFRSPTSESRSVLADVVNSSDFYDGLKLITRAWINECLNQY
jgi:hypothetical protein